MGPLVWPIAAGIASVAGSLFANRSNRASADKQMAFQERMSSTAAQRAVEDYKKAGLNPYLAYDRPASSPGGSMSVAEDSVTKGISSASAAKVMQENIKLLQEETAKTKAERGAAEFNATLLQNTLQERTQTEIAKLRNEREILQPSSDLIRAQLQLLRYSMAGAKAQSDFDQTMGRLGPALQTLSPLLGPLSNIFRKAPVRGGVNISTNPVIKLPK